MKRALTRLAVLLLVPPVSAESAGANKARLETIASLEAVVPAAVGPALEDMARTWPERCDAAKHRCLLDALQQRDALLAALRQGQPDAVGRAEELVREVRATLLANPLVHDLQILFVVRPQFANEHGPDETMFQSNEHNARFFAGRGALQVLDLATGQTRTLLEVPQGIARDPVVHFDGRRILFSMRRNREDDYHLYEIQADGSGLKQLTFAPHVTDIQPVWLPDGRILFSSTRQPKYIQCQRHLMASLFLMEGDGANIRQVGFNTLFEGRSSLLPDGRVLYSRWEYVDKHFSSAYGLWTMNPDGTANSLATAVSPGSRARSSTAARFPAAANCCASSAAYTTTKTAPWYWWIPRGNDGPETIVRSWPPDLTPLLKQWNVVGRARDYDSFRRVAVRYQNPHPLSEKYFLCALGRCGVGRPAHSQSATPGRKWRCFSWMCSATRPCCTTNRRVASSRSRWLLRRRRP